MSHFRCFNGFGTVKWSEVGDQQDNCRDGSDEDNVKEVMRQIQKILESCGISLEACNSETINIKDADKITEILKIVQEDNENLAHLSKMLEKKIEPNHLSTATEMLLKKFSNFFTSENGTFSDITNNITNMLQDIEKNVAEGIGISTTNLLLGLGVTALLAYKFAPKMYQWWKKRMEKWETDKLTDKLERVVVDSKTDEDTDTVNKEEVESINGEKTEAPDNNEEEEEIVNRILEILTETNNILTETNNDNVTETEVFESINNENAQNDDSPLVAVVKPIKNNKETEDEDNEGRKKRKRN